MVSILSSGSLRQSLAINDFLNIQIIRLKDDNLVRQFNIYYEKFLSRISSYRQELTTLSVIRDTLLTCLISGELRVLEAEKILKEAGV